MKDSVNVLFVCGYGMGTSTMAELMVNKSLKAKGISAEVKHTSLGEMGSMRDWADIICILKKFLEGVEFKPEEHVIPLVNIMDGAGIAEKIGGIVDEYYPEARK
ncbi:MAG: hypothetical protein PHV18_02135 [Lachnospiraceae bacterium]|nr:hypothetical protein [Lachnospiraceae bacterium]